MYIYSLYLWLTNWEQNTCNGHEASSTNRQSQTIRRIYGRVWGFKGPKVQTPPNLFLQFCIVKVDGFELKPPPEI